MIKKALLGLSYLVFPTSFAHDTQEAFLNIEVSKESVHVKSEFPWTIRKALFKFDSTLDNSTNTDDIQTSFIRYVQSNLILTDYEGIQLELLKVYQAENAGHSHQTNYNFIYKGEELHKVTNTLLFNINDNQKNYHSLSKTNFTTIQKRPSFILNVSDKINYYWLLLPLFSLLALLIVKLKSIFLNKSDG